MKKKIQENNTDKEIKKVRKYNISKVFSKFLNLLKKKWLINGSKTIILLLIVILIYIGANILLEKVMLPEIDFTENKIYSLSQETEDKIGNIEKEINITLINYSNYQSLMNFVEKYVKLNKNINVEKIDDLSSRIDLMQEYTLEATDSLIIIKSGENEKTLTDSDLYTMDYTTYEEIDITEEAITNAIVEVTVDKKPKIYFMNNHLMYDIQYYSGIMEEIKKDANEVDTVDILANGRVPEDCDCLIISTLKEDITEQERDKIIEYITNGGEILMLCGPNITNIQLTNFEKVLEQYGLTVSNGVVFEGNSSNMMAGYPDFIIEGTSTTTLTEKLNMSMNLCMIDAGKITFNEDKLSELGVEYEILATTSNKAFLRTNLNIQSATRTNQDGEEEVCNIAAIVTKSIGEAESKLIIYSNELFAMDMPVKINGYTMYTVNLYNNKDIILNSISYLNKREDTITIRKNYEVDNYTVTEQQNTIIMIIIFVLPVLIILTGIIIWQVRRRKK